MHTFARSMSTPPVVRSYPKIPSTHINKTLSYMARAHSFSTFNSWSPIILVQRHDILESFLKSVPLFTSETFTSLIEHIQNV